MTTRKYARWTAADVANVLRLKDEEGLTWNEVKDRISPLSVETAKSHYYKIKRGPWAGGATRQAKKSDKGKDIKEAPIADEVAIDNEDLPIGLHREESGNELQLTAKTDWIKTLDELIKAAEIDLDEWTITQRVVGAWPGWAKHKASDLTFDEGKISGWIKQSGDLVTAQLWLVKAWLVKKNPEPIHPVIQPISVEGRKWKKQPERMWPSESAIRRALIVSDGHVGFRRSITGGSGLSPFHDREAMGAVLELADRVKPNVFVVLGDMLDLPDLSDKYLRSPDMVGLLQPALIELHWWLHQVRQIVGEDCDILYFEGNHEARFDKAMQKHIPAAYGLRKVSMGFIDVMAHFSLPAVLNLDELGIEWVGGYPNTSRQIAPALLEVSHGDIARAQSNSTAQRMLDGQSISQVSGHVHRQEIATKLIRTMSGSYEPVHAVVTGCLCRTDGSVPGHNPRRQNWTQGVAIAEWSPLSLAIPVQIRIDQGKLIYNGEMISGASYGNELRQAFPQYGF